MVQGARRLLRPGLHFAGIVGLLALPAHATAYEPAGVLLLLGFLGAIALIPVVAFLAVTLVPAAAAYRLTRGGSGRRRAAAAAAAAVPGLVAAIWMAAAWRADVRREAAVAACGSRPGGGYLTAPGPAPLQKSLVAFDGWADKSHLELQIWEDSDGCPQGRLVSRHDLGVRGERPRDFLSAWSAAWSPDGARLVVKKKGADGESVVAGFDRPGAPPPRPR